jgi:uncharacterized RDD family membrane protein YckC/Tfp pilus assembly protein PilF
VSDVGEFFAPSPAPLGKRVAAGVFDFFVLWSLVAASFLVPMFLRGFSLPMWGVLLVMLGYQVVPLSAFRQTLGMRLFGVELVTRAGHAVGAGEVLFRELVGRGLFPAAFLATVVLGLIANLLHVMAFVMPTGMGFMFFVVCGFAVAFAVLGHFLVFNRQDQRTLADLIAKSYVTAARPKVVHEDAEDAAYMRTLDKKRIRNVAIFEIICAGLVFLGPWLLTQRVEGTESRALRLKLHAQEEKAKSYPEDMQVLRELWDLQRYNGQAEEAAATYQKMQALEVKKEEAREQGLRNLLAKDPSNRRVVGDLLEILEDKGKRDEARAVYAKFVEDNPRPSLRAGFADWLSEREWHEEALAQMKQALADDPEMGAGHRFLAEVLEAAGQKEEAHKEYYLGTRLEPDDEDAFEGLARLDAELGPLAKAVTKELDKLANPSAPPPPGKKAAKK